MEDACKIRPVASILFPSLYIPVESRANEAILAKSYLRLVLTLSDFLKELAYSSFFLLLSRGRSSTHNVDF